MIALALPFRSAQGRTALPPFVTGDDLEVSVTLTQLEPDGLGGFAGITAGWLTLKSPARLTAPDDDSGALWQCAIVVAASDDGQITDAGATTGTATALFFVPSEVSAQLAAPFEYDVQFRDSAGHIRTPAIGPVAGLLQVTRTGLSGLAGALLTVASVDVYDSQSEDASDVAALDLSTIASLTVS